MTNTSALKFILLVNKVIHCILTVIFVKYVFCDMENLLVWIMRRWNLRFRFNDRSFPTRYIKLGGWGTCSLFERLRQLARCLFVIYAISGEAIATKESTKSLTGETVSLILATRHFNSRIEVLFTQSKNWIRPTWKCTMHFYEKHERNRIIVYSSVRRSFISSRGKQNLNFHSWLATHENIDFASHSVK